MKYFLDTEFIEYPYTIQLISIGIVSEDGREYYAESNEWMWKHVNKTKDKGKWLKENAFPNLNKGDFKRKSTYEIRNEILAFINEGNEAIIGDDKPEFWGYYADYDWVIFCWLFGAMIDLPRGWPMYCRDIKQLADQYNVDLSQNNEHNALADARWNKKAFEYILQQKGITRMNLYLYDQHHEEIVAIMPLEENISYDNLDKVIHFLEENKVMDSYKCLIIAKGYEKVDLGEGHYGIIFQY